MESELSIEELKLINRREKQRQYRIKNREIYNEKQNKLTKEWYQRNRESVCLKKRIKYNDAILIKEYGSLYILQENL